MIAVLQRVSQASVTVDNSVVGKIDHGFLILLGIAQNDSIEDIHWLIKKIINMRIFSDDDGKMNLSVKDQNGSFLVVSQFTLQASTKKGNRPSFIKAAKPEFAIPLYEKFCDTLKIESHLNVQQGVFGADMKVQLLNDGPVTIILDSKDKK